MKIRLHLAAFALVLSLFGNAARAAEPAVTLTFDPLENGSLIYAPVGALSGFFPANGRLWFKVSIRNDDAGTLTLTSIRVILTGVDVTIPQTSIAIAANTTKTITLAEEETVTIPHPAANSVTFRFTFSENITPKTIVVPLAPYTPAVPGSAYLFPANETDLGPEEYFSGGSHLPPHGQRWGTDWKVYRIISTGSDSQLVPGGDDTVNADYLGWGIPIRAMADGTVLRVSNGWANNPTAGTRSFQLMGERDGEAISDVKIAHLGETAPGSRVERCACLVRLPDDSFKITIWDVSNNSRNFTQLGSSTPVPGEIVRSFAIEAVSLTEFVTSLRLTSDTHRYIVWTVSEDGQTLTRSNPYDDVAVTEVALAKLTGDRMASAVRTTAGNLRVAIFGIGSNPGLFDDETAGAASSVCVSQISGSRFATSLRTNTGALKVIVWDYASSLITRRGEQTANNISRVASTESISGKWVTAMRTSPGNLLQLARWSASEDGMTLTPELVTTTTQSILNTALDVAPGTGNDGPDNAATASVIAGNIFKVNLWGDPDDFSTYKYTAQNEAGAITALSMVETGDLFYFAGVRTAGGNLKLLTWHVGDGGGNSVYVLHGDCRVFYAHLLENSIDESVIFPGAVISAGQRLGGMGNSGSSGSPHTHIHADRISPITSVPDMIARERLGTLPTIGARPIPFREARVLRKSWINPGGEGNANNNFTTMNGHGVFEIALGIRPGINARYVDRTNARPAPNGRKEWLPGPPETGGPFSTVPLGLSGAASGTRMFIRSGSYAPPVTFRTPMIVRRYDYFENEGAVVIGK